MLMMMMMMMIMMMIDDFDDDDDVQHFVTPVSLRSGSNQRNYKQQHARHVLLVW